MCDLAAPLLILFDEESLVYSCFVKLMDRITFQKGNAMDVRLANLRSLIQVSLNLCIRIELTNFALWVRISAVVCCMGQSLFVFQLGYGFKRR